MMETSKCCEQWAISSCASNIMNELKVYRKDYKYDRFNYLDPFKEDEFKVSGNRWKSYVESTYGLTPREVYNVVNDFPKDYIGKCKYCGSETRWIQFRGYSSVCMTKECRKRHNSERCTSTLNKLWSTEEYRNQIHESRVICGKKLAERAKLRPDYHEYMRELGSRSLTKSNKNFKFRSKMMKNAFISKGSEGQVAYFYVGFTWNRLKFGITYNKSTRPYVSGIQSPHILATSNRIYIAELEMEVKNRLETLTEYISPIRLPEFFVVFRCAVQRLSRQGVHLLDGGKAVPHKVMGEDIV